MQVAAMREQQSEDNYEKRLEFLNDQVKNYELRIDQMQLKLNNFENDQQNVSFRQQIISPLSSPGKDNANVSELEHKIQVLQHELKDARS